MIVLRKLPCYPLAVLQISPGDNVGDSNVNQAVINNNNNGYFQVLFLRRAHNPFINKNNGVNIELGRTNRFKALCMMQNNTSNKQTMCQ